MTITVRAEYEAGLLRPLTPLSALADHDIVDITITPVPKPAAPRVRRAEHVTDHSRVGEWLQTHRDEYRGHWVVLDNDRLVGHSANPDDIDAVVEQARAEGVRSPFIKLIPLDDEPIWPGIL